MHSTIDSVNISFFLLVSRTIETFFPLFAFSLSGCTRWQSVHRGRRDGLGHFNEMCPSSLQLQHRIVGFRFKLVLSSFLFVMGCVEFVFVYDLLLFLSLRSYKFRANSWKVSRISLIVLNRKAAVAVCSSRCLRPSRVYLMIADSLSLNRLPKAQILKQ